MLAHPDGARPRVSVVIPAFDAAHDVAVALDSVFGQTFSSFEVVLVNDGSPDPDALEAAIAPYRSRLRYIVQTNRGAGAARNAALGVACGELVAFLDADDRWTPDFLARQVSYLDAHPACALVYCDARISGESPLAGRRFMEEAPSHGPVTLVSLIRQTCNIPLSTVVMRRDRLVAAGFFDESLRRGQDFELWLRLAADGVSMAYQSAVLAERRVRMQGLSGSPVDEIRRALTVLEQFSKRRAIDFEARTALRVRMAELVDRLEIERAKQRICEANFAAARQHLASLRRCPMKLRLALVGLRVAPRLLRRIYLSQQPPAWTAVAAGVAVMRVLHLAPPSPRPDAVTAHTFIDEEIRAIAATGVECTVVSDEVTREEVRDGIRLIPVPPRPSGPDLVRTIGFAAAHAGAVAAAAGSAREMFHAVRIERLAARAVARGGIDLVHSHFGWPGGFGGALTAASARVPLVASLRGMDLLTCSDVGYGLRQDGAYDGAVRRLLRRASRTMYATEFMRRAGLAAGAPGDRAIVVRKGVDLRRFHPAADRPAARRRLHVEGPLVLGVGGLTPRKDYATVLDALARIADVPWTLVLCGDGGERAALEARAAALGIRPRVRFAGTVDRTRIGEYFAAADVFVHAARLEAAGNVVLESLAAGCPVVCTDGGGPPEYVDEGETGFVVPVGDCGAIADRVRQLVLQPALRASMSIRTREVAEARHAYGRMIGDYLSVYDAALAEGRAARGRRVVGLYRLGAVQ